MSADRRRYLERARVRRGAGRLATERDGPDTSETAVLVSDGATPGVGIVRRTPAQRQAAYEQAERMAVRDPEAAAFLLAQLDAEARVLAEAPAATAVAMAENGVAGTAGAGATEEGSMEPFDPMRLLADLAKHYHWTDADMRRMPMKRLLAYHREAMLWYERRAAAEQAQATAWRAEHGQGDLGDGLAPVTPDEAEAAVAAFAGPAPIAWSS